MVHSVPRIDFDQVKEVNIDILNSYCVLILLACKLILPCPDYVYWPVNCFQFTMYAIYNVILSIVSNLTMSNIMSYMFLDSRLTYI